MTKEKTDYEKFLEIPLKQRVWFLFIAPFVLLMEGKIFAGLGGILLFYWLPIFAGTFYPYPKTASDSNKLKKAVTFPIS